MSQADDITRAIKELAKREGEYECALNEQVDAEFDYRQKKNMEIQKAEGSEKVKIATAEIICAKEMKRKLYADSRVIFLKDQLLDVRSVLSARQSILSAESRNFQMAEKYSA